MNGEASPTLVGIIGSALNAVERKREIPQDDIAMHKLKESVAGSLAEFERLKDCSA
jgi:hypothetical protein